MGGREARTRTGPGLPIVPATYTMTVRSRGLGLGSGREGTMRGKASAATVLSALTMAITCAGGAAGASGGVGSRGEVLRPPAHRRAPSVQPGFQDNVVIS